MSSRINSATAIVVVALVLIGCHVEGDVQRECLPVEDAAEKRANFILQCAKAANPMSDEEGEDLVAQCERTSDRLFCRHVWAVRPSGAVSWIPCEHAGVEDQSDCRNAGWGANQ